jgi:hypothetical protein
MSLDVDQSVAMASWAPALHLLEYALTSYVFTRVYITGEIRSEIATPSLPLPTSIMAPLALFPGDRSLWIAMDGLRSYVRVGTVMQQQTFYAAPVTDTGNASYLAGYAGGRIAFLDRTATLHIVNVDIMGHFSVHATIATGLPLHAPLLFDAYLLSGNLNEMVFILQRTDLVTITDRGRGIFDISRQTLPTGAEVMSLTASGNQLLVGYPATYQTRVYEVRNGSPVFHSTIISRCLWGRQGKVNRFVASSAGDVLDLVDYAYPVDVTVVRRLPKRVVPSDWRITFVRVGPTVAQLSYTTVDYRDLRAQELIML